MENDNNDTKSDDDFNKNEFPQNSPFEIASWPQRFFNYLFDAIFFTVFYYALNFLLVKIGLGIVYEPFENAKFALVQHLDKAILYIVYYVFFEALFQRTPAKVISQTIVVNRDGTKPRFLSIFFRTLLRFIPFEQLTFFGEHSVGIHDYASKTFVILNPKK